MGNTLTGQIVAETYDSLLKVTDNNQITGTKKRLTDGFGTDTPLLVSTTDVQVDGNFLIESAQFNTATIQTGGIGKLIWNDQDGTLDLGLKGGNVTLQVGQEQVIRIVNKTGSNLLEANYQVVRVDGAQGNRLKVALAQANNDANSAETLGLVTETINDNQEGFITTSGLVRNINTTGSLQGETWADGDMLYLSGTTAGRLTNVKPAAPIHTVIMGYVVRSHATQGQIFVKVDNGYELDELHNVLITTPTDGQVLAYEASTGLWKNTTNGNIGGSGTTNYITKFTGSTSLGNSQIFDNGTNVGIGTATPGYKLHVVGSIYLNPATNYNVLFQNSGTTLRMNYLNDAGSANVSAAFRATDFAWQKGDGVETMRITSGGNVGIGTSSPNEKLSVIGAISANNGMIVQGYSAAASGLNCEMGVVSGYVQYNAYNRSTSAYGQFRLDGSSLILNAGSGGNVGIGTSSPQARLHSDSDILTGYFQNGTNGIYDALKLTNNTASNTLSGNGARIQFYNNANNGTTLVGGSIRSINVDYGWASDLVLSSVRNNGYLSQTVNDAIWIKNTGNVGIGLTNPLMRLDLYGTSGLPATSGTTPIGSLRLHASNNAVLDFGVDHGTANGWIQSSDQGGLNSYYGLLLNPRGGNVGVGNTNPQYKLDVTGGINYQNQFNRQTASYTLVLSDASKIVEMNVGSANNLTVPLNSSQAFPIGTEIQVLQYGAGQTTIVATSGVTLRSKSGQLKIANQYTGVTLVKVGTDEWYVVGNLSA